MKYFTLLILSCLPVLADAQLAETGRWKAIDDETGNASSVIEISQQNGLLHGKIVKLFEHPDDTLCDKCEGDKKDKPIVGMEILWGMKKDGDSWKGGKILDPKVGKSYKCQIKLNNDVLEVRGYIGLPALGRTQKWHRIE